MTNTKTAAREYAKQENGKAGMYCSTCWQKKGAVANHFLAGAEHGRREVQKLMHKAFHEHFPFHYTSPTTESDGAFWFGLVLDEIIEKLKGAEGEGK